MEKDTNRKNSMKEIEILQEPKHEQHHFRNNRLKIEGSLLFFCFSKMSLVIHPIVNYQGKTCKQKQLHTKIYPHGRYHQVILN